MRRAKTFAGKVARYSSTPNAHGGRNHNKFRQDSEEKSFNLKSENMNGASKTQTPMAKPNNSPMFTEVQIRRGSIKTISASGE